MHSPEIQVAMKMESLTQTNVKLFIVFMYLSLCEFS